MIRQNSDLSFPLENVLPDVDNWAINKLSQNKEAFLNEVIDKTVAYFEKQFPTESALYDKLAGVVYQERIRVTQKAWKADKPNEKEYWSGIKQRLVQLKAEAEKNDKPNKNNALLKEIVSGYAWEIVGNFQPKTYEFAINAVPFFLSKIVKTTAGRRARAGKKSIRKSIYDKFHFTGYIEEIRALTKIGTVVVVPTHFSNLDSPTVGWSLQSVGLPPFVYGAGLNLFGIRLLAYYMSRLGAYKVDRRKKHVVYLETLKNYSSVALQHDVHSLFFPGGTRSRSGVIEKKLKLGLLGTTIEAQRLNIMKANGGDFKKIFIVPVSLNYHTVLEAPALIEQHLKAQGKERYLAENDKFSSSLRMIKFITQFLRQSSEITVSFGKPMDIFGNTCTVDGKSLNHRGVEVDVKDYFITNGTFTNDNQRDQEYARLLADKIVDGLHKANTVLSSHLVAFVAYQIISKRYPDFDIFSLLRLPKEDTSIDYAYFSSTVDKIRYMLIQMDERGEVMVADNLKTMSAEELIKHGLKHVGMFHAKRTLYHSKRKGQIRTSSMKQLYFYHNRLLGYKVEQYV